LAADPFVISAVLSVPDKGRYVPSPLSHPSLQWDVSWRWLLVAEVTILDRGEVVAQQLAPHSGGTVEYVVTVGPIVEWPNPARAVLHVYVLARLA
jgi:hypothetical protein